MSNKKALTLEQFIDLVKEKYLELGPAESDKDALKYFFSDEAQNHIKAEYKSSLDNFNNGLCWRTATTACAPVPPGTLSP